MLSFTFFKASQFEAIEIVMKINLGRAVGTFLFQLFFEFSIKVDVLESPSKYVCRIE